MNSRGKKDTISIIHKLSLSITLVIKIMLMVDMIVIMMGCIDEVAKKRTKCITCETWLDVVQRNLLHGDTTVRGHTIQLTF